MSTSAVPTEVALRRKLYEVDSASDAARQESDAIPRLAALASERQKIQDQLDILLPPNDMGYQGNQERFKKQDNEHFPIPQIGYP